MKEPCNKINQGHVVIKSCQIHFFLPILIRVPAVESIKKLIRPRHRIVNSVATSCNSIDLIELVVAVPGDCKKKECSYFLFMMYTPAMPNANINGTRVPGDFVGVGVVVTGAVVAVVTGVVITGAVVGSGVGITSRMV